MTREEFLLNLKKFATTDDLFDLEDRLIESIRQIHEENKPAIWLRSADVISQLGISDTTLRDLRRHGHIKCSKLGGAYFYNRTDIDNLLEDLTINKKENKGIDE